MVRKTDPVQHRSVSITIDGKTYSGTFNLSDKEITVSYQGKSKSALLAGPSAVAATLARVILGDLVKSG